MRFQKGQKPNNYGRGCFQKGHKVPESWRFAVSKAQKGKRKPKTKEWIENNRLSIIEGFRTGRRIKITGKKHWNWKGGITKRNLHSKSYLKWRNNVFKRDNYKCVRCGYDKGRILEAHHIKSWKDYPKLRFNISNGETLCVYCHRKTDTFGGKKITW